MEELMQLNRDMIAYFGDWESIVEAYCKRHNIERPTNFKVDNDLGEHTIDYECTWMGQTFHGHTFDNARSGSYVARASLYSRMGLHILKKHVEEADTLIVTPATTPM